MCTFIKKVLKEKNFQCQRDCTDKRNRTLKFHKILKQHNKFLGKITVCSFLEIVRNFSVSPRTIHLGHYLLTPWSRGLLEKLRSFQLVKKFPAFYGTWRFITPITSACHLSLSQASSIQSMPPIFYFLKSHLNIIFLSMSGSSKSSLCIRFPHQGPYSYLCQSHSARGLYNNSQSSLKLGTPIL